MQYTACRERIIGRREKRGSTPLCLLRADARTARIETAPVTSSPLSLASVLRSFELLPPPCLAYPRSIHCARACMLLSTADVDQASRVYHACLPPSARQPLRSSAPAAPSLRRLRRDALSAPPPSLLAPSPRACAGCAIVAPAALSSWTAGAALRHDGQDGSPSDSTVASGTPSPCSPPGPRRIQVRCRLSSQPPMPPRARASRAPQAASDCAAVRSQRHRFLSTRCHCAAALLQSPAP
jgi:hypothetical protein